MKRMLTFFAFLLTFAFITASSAHASLGLVNFESTPSDTRLHTGEFYIIKATIYTTYSDPGPSTPCVHCAVTIKFLDQQPDDVVSPANTTTDENGRASVRVTSAHTGDRLIYAIVTMPDGSLYQSSRFIVGYNLSEQDTTTPQKVTGITITSQRLVDSVKGRMRQVTLKWDGPIGKYDYSVFFNPHAENNGWAGSGESTTYPYATIPYMLADEENDIKVQTCLKGTTEGCVDSDIILLGVYDEKHPGTINQTKELDTRLASLEAKVKQTEKKQGFLESQLAGILSFLKRIFPFWK